MKFLQMLDYSERDMRNSWWCEQDRVSIDSGIAPLVL